MRNIFVVVHAEAEHHLRGIVGGWHDSQLTSRGLDQAASVADAVRAWVPVGAPCQVYSSDLSRARQTAAPIAASLGADVVTDARLRELSYGAAEGRPDAWLQARFVPAPEDNRLDHGSNIEGAETKRQFASRIYAAMDDILAADIEHQVIVTHGFALTFVVMAWARIPIEAVGWVNLSSTAGGITHLAEDDFFHNRGVRFLNRVDHLDHVD
ncbi:MAG TPA: histidine phosphatase family protein [Acidimicrobiales bacterium]|nr:histidine phosphatase family protein [Acidimicrobiales bacterium]